MEIVEQTDAVGQHIHTLPSMLLSKIIRTNLINKLDILPKLSASNLSGTQLVCLSCSLITDFVYFIGQVMDLKSVVASLNELYPLKNACDWDNVGLLLEPSKEKPIKNILLTNDLTEKVMDEAIEKHTDLIISYHPPLFRSFKRITCADWKERNIIRCLENRIAVYSPHTAVDAQIGGVNDWLLSPWQQWENYKPIEESCAEDNNAGVRFFVYLTIKTILTSFYHPNRMSEWVGLAVWCRQQQYARLSRR